MSTDELEYALDGLSWSDFEASLSEFEDRIADITGGHVESIVEYGLAQTETQRRRRGRGGRGRKSGGWGKHIKNAAKDAGKSIGTSMAEDAAWCAMGDPLNVVGCKKEEEEKKSGSGWWFAQQDTVGELYDQVGGMTVD